MKREKRSDLRKNNLWSTKTVLPIFFLISVIFFGCATSFSSSDFKKEFTNLQLSENLFKVSYSGARNFNDEKITELTLLRSAEIAQEKGFEYFSIVADNNSTDTTNTASSKLATTSYSIAGPSHSNIIRCFKGTPLGISYNVNVIIPSLRKKYNIKD